MNRYWMDDDTAKKYAEEQRRLKNLEDPKKIKRPIKRKAKQEKK